tara:strand:+ start:79 stop:663 length:585 start_codon:yes stop_codon:yes gene_type:complete
MTIKLYPPEFLFPTKILSSEDTNFSSYRDDMIQWMIDYSYKHTTVAKSNQGGYQSPDQFYLEESFAPYLNRISEHLISTIDEYTRDDRSCLHLDDLKLSNMWFNFNYENCYNVQHTHPGCVLSGVLWIQIPEEQPIVFSCFDEFTRATYEKYTNESLVAKEGQLLLFPAHLPHRVDINRSKNTRISISFNIIRI